MACIIQNLISRTSHIIALASCNVNLQSRCVPNLHAVPLPAAQGRTTPLPVKRTSLPKRHHASTREPRCRGGYAHTAMLRQSKSKSCRTLLAILDSILRCRGETTASCMPLRSRFHHRNAPSRPTSAQCRVSRLLDGPLRHVAN